MISKRYNVKPFEKTFRLQVSLSLFIHKMAGFTPEAKFRNGERQNSIKQEYKLSFSTLKAISRTISNLYGLRSGPCSIDNFTLDTLLINAKRCVVSV